MNVRKIWTELFQKSAGRLVLFLLVGGIFLAFILMRRTPQPKPDNTPVASQATQAKSYSFEEDIQPLSRSQATPSPREADGIARATPTPKPPPPIPQTILATREQSVSEWFLPYGRLLRCELVNTVESTNIDTPIIGLLIEDIWNGAFPPGNGAGDETRTRDINLGKGDRFICRVAKSGNRRPTTSLQPLISTSAVSGSRFINPHRLFHGVWLPQWLEERPEVSEKAKKLYAYLTYFAGGKGCSWPSFGLLGEKLHCSRRHVMRLVQELSTHRLITVTNVSNPERGHCANYYRFLWHPWMQTERDAKFVLATVEGEPVDFSEESAPDNCQAGTTPGDICVTSPLVTSRSPAPGDMPVTSPGDIHVTPLVTPMSPKENNKKRINNRGKVPATSSGTSPSKMHSTAAPPPKVLSDTTKIILERRVAELRTEIATASKRGNPDRAEQLHTELIEHQTKLGFTPDDPPPKPNLSARNEESHEPADLSDWPSPEEVRATFNEARRSMGWPIKR